MASILSRLFACDCRRGASPYLPGMIAPDVIGLPGVHVESKRRGLFSLPAALRQSQAEAHPAAVPIVCHRPNRAPWTVTVALCDLPRLAAAVASLLPNNACGNPLATPQSLHTTYAGAPHG